MLLVKYWQYYHPLEIKRESVFGKFETLQWKQFWMFKTKSEGCFRKEIFATRIRQSKLPGIIFEEQILTQWLSNSELFTYLSFVQLKNLSAKLESKTSREKQLAEKLEDLR